MARFNFLFFEFKRGWVAYLGIFLLLMVGFSFDIKGIFLGPEHGDRESAMITSFSPLNSRTNAGKIVVSASDSEGVSGTSWVVAAQVQGCKVGDRIEAERIGVYLKLNLKPCN